MNAAAALFLIVLSQATALVPAATQPPPSARVLTLSEALRAAREQHPQLRQARAGREAAWARADQAKSGLLPQISGNATYRYSANPSQNVTALGAGTVSTSSINASNYYSVGISASQLVWDFGQTLERWRAARVSAEAQDESARAVERSVVLLVETGFFNARAARSLVEVARQTLANQERHLAQIQGFVEVGTRPEIDLAQARTDVANAQVQLISAENSYLTARVQLNQAMGVRGPADYDVADDISPPIEGEDAPSQELLTAALHARPELAQLRLQLRAQELTMKSIRGNYFPTLGVGASLSENARQLDNWNWSFIGTVNLSWPLFQGFLTRNQVREARANVESLAAQADQVRNQVSVEVEQARLAVRASKAQIVAADVAVVNAQQRLSLAEGRYETGVGNAIELGDAQVAFTRASVQRVQSEYQLATSRAQLRAAVAWK